MNEEIDDTGSSLQDFTAVSEWEIFILRIEETLAEWKIGQIPKECPLPAGAFRDCTWKVSKEHITFGDEEFILARYKLNYQSKEINVDVLEESGKQCQAMIDMSTNSNDFGQLENNSQNDIPPLGLWFGLREFILLIPSVDVTSESKIKTLLSSITIAVNNSNCNVPLFVQCRELWQNCFLGVCESKGICIKFDTIHLKKIPTQCHYLVGLIDLFDRKIAASVTMGSVQISAKFTYILSDWLSAIWTQSPPDFDFLHGKTTGINAFSNLPFGAILDPIKNLSLYVSWLNLSGDAIIDTETYTDFDPFVAPLWSMSINMVDKPSGLLFEYYNDFIDLSHNHMSLKELLDEISVIELNTSNSKIPIIRSSLEVNNKMMGEPYLQRNEYAGLLSDEIVRSILHFLFDDAKQDSEQSFVDEKSSFYIGGDSLKAGQANDLVWRLAVVSAQVSQVLGDANALAHVWFEFCQEVRYRWDNSVNINGIMDGFPNSRTCLLHQKLQMLNICIDRRKTRDEAALIISVVPEDGSEESEEEFYECDEDEETVTRKKIYAACNKPVGRLGMFGNLKLTETGEHLYIPITQEPVPKTEDQLEQDAEVMLNLGSDPQASEMIARIMSASLLSDMESFKAANPGAIFDDFIRWYSPRDWIEEEELDDYGQKKGHLSARMLIPDNMWLEVWGSANAVPAKRQRRLFDDTKEAEKILHFLISRNISQIVNLLLPSLTSAVVTKLAEECRNKKELPLIEAHFERLKATAQKLTRDKAMPEKYKKLAEQLYNMEIAIAQLKSLKDKFEFEDDINDEARVFLSGLLSGGVTRAPGGSRGDIGTRAAKIMRGLPHSAPPSPASKEFVLRRMAARPVPASAPTLQMMRVFLKHDEFRILGAFSEDTVFT